MKPASHRDQLVAMLCEAAEVEHCLMCTYLYGAFSLKQRTDEDLTDYVGEFARLRQRFPQLKPHRWVEGKKPDGSYDVKWLTPKGSEMSETDWNFPDGRFLAYILGPAAEQGEPLLIVLNGADDAVDVTGPEWPRVARWACVIDSVDGQSNSATLEVGGRWSAQPRSVLAFAGES